MTLPPEATDNEWACGAFSESGFRCTAAYGHDGDHVARDTTDTVCASWKRRIPA